VQFSDAHDDVQHKGDDQSELEAKQAVARDNQKCDPRRERENELQEVQQWLGDGQGRCSVGSPNELIFGRCQMSRSRG
jgi:hypothetical protein